jgi:RNA polymerase sigma-70 factor
MSCAPDDVLWTVCEGLYLGARAIHGGLDLSFDCFFNRMLSLLGKFPERSQGYDTCRELLNNLHTDDLFLSFACTEGSEAAWQKMDLSYRKYICDIARLISGSSQAGSDIATSVFADLFLPDRFGQSLIASYDGQSALVTWLRVIVTRRLINEQQRKSNQVERLESLPDIIDKDALAKINSSVRGNKYQRAISASLKRASLSLSERERLLLILRYEDSMQMSDIARFLNVHPSTITRQLQQVYKKLQNGIISALGTEYNQKGESLEECITDLLENPSHSILTAIKPT